LNPSKIGVSIAQPVSNTTRWLVLGIRSAKHPDTPPQNPQVNAANPHGEGTSGATIVRRAADDFASQ